MPPPCRVGYQPTHAPLPFNTLASLAEMPPLCRAGYQAATGHWPDFSNQDDIAKLGAEAFAFVNVARFAIPLRIGLALGTTPWVQANIVDKFQKKDD